MFPRWHVGKHVQPGQVRPAFRFEIMHHHHQTSTNSSMRARKVTKKEGNRGRSIQKLRARSNITTTTSSETE
jgi:hypothetical protein